MTFKILILDVAAEKTQQTLIAGIEKFDTAQLKHTETQEKNPLPDKEGKLEFTKICSLHLFDQKHERDLIDFTTTKRKDEFCLIENFMFVFVVNYFELTQLALHFCHFHLI